MAGTFQILKTRLKSVELTKIMKPIHDDGEFLSVNDAFWLEVLFDSHDHFSTWLLGSVVHPKETD